MQKFVTLLEEKVEWLALALGGLFFLWMVWGNVVNPPGTVNVNGKTLAAGDVDKAIYEGTAQRVEGALNSRGHVPADWAAKSPMTEFVQALNPTTKPSTVLAFRGVQRGVVPPEEVIPQQPGTALVTGPTGQPQRIVITEQQKVEKLPALPPAAPFGVLAGMSSVVPQPGQQLAAALPPAPASANGQPQAIDKSWASVSFKVSSTDIAKAFQQAKVPLGFKTFFLDLQAVREEQLPDGKWGNATIVHTPAVANQPPYPSTAGLPALAARSMEAAYVQWAQGNQPTIIQPAFYQVTAGTTWHVPGFDVPKVMVAFNPQTYTGPLDTLTKEQKDQVMAARREAAKQRALQHQAPRGGGGGFGGGSPRGFNPGRGGGGGGGGGDTGFAPRPASAAPRAAAGSGEVSYQYRPPFNPRFAPPQPVGDMAPEDMGDNGIYGNQGPQFQAGQLTPEQQKQLLAPTNEFDPATFDQIIVWVNDDSVEAGKTYRYKLRYRMKNPIYLVSNVAVNDQLMNKFDLTSDDRQSAWSSDVAVPARTQFFVRQGISPSGNTVTFELFNFQNGQLWSKVTPVAIGDQIGSPDGNVDYTTPWTVADIRVDGRTTVGYVILVDQYGRTERRDSSDVNDPAYKDLQQQVLQQTNQQRQAAGLPPLPTPGTFGAAR